MADCQSDSLVWKNVVPQKHPQNWIAATFPYALDVYNHHHHNNKKIIIMIIVSSSHRMKDHVAFGSWPPADTVR